ncbi:cyclin-T1-like [Argonauta hians]
MAGSEKEERWLFTKSDISRSPSTRGPDSLDPKKELHYRQLAANFIQEMGQKLQVTQLCINTAIVYMHRFYMLRCFQKFSRNQMGSVCLYLAAKVEEQPRKLEHVIKVAYVLQHRDGNLDTKSETYLMMTTDLVRNENILLQTLGFDLTVDHPHTHVVKTCQMVRASKDLAQTSYFLATNSLHLTTMCLMYKPTVVACVCIHLASKWGNWELQSSAEGKPWYSYVEKSVTPELLEELTIDFLEVLDGCPTRLKKKIMTWRSGRGDKDDDKDGTPEKKSRTDARGSNSTTASSNSPGTSAPDNDYPKERLNAGCSSPSDRKVRFKMEAPVKVLSQLDKSGFPMDTVADGVTATAASAAAVGGGGGSGASSSTSNSNNSNQKIDQRKKMHKSSVPRADSSKSSSDRHSHIVRQNAPLKLTIKTPIPPPLPTVSCDGETKLPGSSQVSGKWSNQNRLKLDNHTSNVSMKPAHNSKVDYPFLDRTKDGNHMVNIKGHVDPYLQKSTASRIDPMLQSSAASSKSHFNPNNAYPVVNPCYTSNDVQFEQTFRHSAKRQKVSGTSVVPYKSTSKQQQLSTSQSARYNSYCQGSDVRLDSEKLIGHNLESNGSGPSNLHSSQALSNPLPTSASTASTSNTTGGREHFGELQMQLQQLIDIQTKNIRVQRQKYALDMHK